MGWIGRAWRGEERLWKTFWVYGVLIGLGIGIIGIVIKSMFGMTAYLAYWVPRLVYTIWITVAQWRCAFNAKWTIWSYVVRILVVLEIIGIILVIAGLLFGGVIVGQDLMKAAQCRKELQEYVAKGGKDTDGFKKQCIARVTHKDAESSEDGPTAVTPGSAIMSGVKAGFECAKEAGAYQKAGGADPKAYQKKCIDDRLQAFKKGIPAPVDKPADAAAPGTEKV